MVRRGSFKIATATYVRKQECERKHKRERDHKRELDRERERKRERERRPINIGDHAVMLKILID